MSGWRKWLAVASCLAVGMLSSVTWAAKPQGPLSVTIKASGKAKPGATATFDVTVTSLMEGELTITLIPPVGSTVTSGEALWRGEVMAHGKKKLSLTVTLPMDEEQEFKALANISGPNGARFGAGASYPIVIKSSPASKQKRSTRQGQEIIEVPVPASK